MIAKALALALAALSVAPPATRDDARDLSPPAAYRRALELMGGPEPTASLPYFRRAAGDPEAPARVHLEYSWMLNDAAIGTRPRLGRITRAARSSWEQVHLELESQAQLDRAERISRDRVERALICAYRGKHLEVWGLPWDALAAYRAAADLDSLWRASASRLEGRLRHPEKSAQGGPLAPAGEPPRP
ncbi:MAG TPA: hypothetical protein VMS88_07635 [Terriglobales bacterium]|nr:hypothetical protein [Terriglobales bacterium]